MTGCEDEAQQVILDLLLGGKFEVLAGQLLLRLQLPPELLVLSLEALSAADLVDGSMPGGTHQPGPRLLWHALSRPPLQGDQEGVLRKILSQAEIADDASQASDQAWRLHSPDGLEGAM